MSAHTPGPWKVGYSGGQYAYEVMTEAVGPRSGKPRIVARIAGGADRREPDARLIAAAPDLYEALRDLLADATAPQDKWCPGSSVERARGALAKVQS